MSANEDVRVAAAHLRHAADEVHREIGEIHREVENDKQRISQDLVETEQAKKTREMELGKTSDDQEKALLTEEAARYRQESQDKKDLLQRKAQEADAVLRRKEEASQLLKTKAAELERQATSPDL